VIEQAILTAPDMQTDREIVAACKFQLLDQEPLLRRSLMMRHEKIEADLTDEFGPLAFEPVGQQGDVVAARHPERTSDPERMDAETRPAAVTPPTLPSRRKMFDMARQIDEPADPSRARPRHDLGAVGGEIFGTEMAMRIDPHTGLDRRRARKTELSPNLEHGHGDCVGQIQAAIAGSHRQAQMRLGADVGQHLSRKARGLGTEHEYIIGAEVNLIRGSLAPRLDGPETPSREARQASPPVGVHAQVRVFMVVESRPAHLGIIEREAERMHEMQLSAGIRAQPNHITRVRRNFGMNEDNGDHEQQVSLMIEPERALSLASHELIEDRAQRAPEDWGEPEQPKLSQSPVTRNSATPVLRAGLTEVLVTGILIR
jgi:hypothetical protein